MQIADVKKKKKEKKRIHNETARSFCICVFIKEVLKIKIKNVSIKHMLVDDVIMKPLS